MKKIACFILTNLLLVSFLTACQEGPAERKGKQIDTTVEKIQDKIQDKGPAQKAGEKVDDLVNE